MKVQKNKIISMLIGGVLVASAGVYAFAAQAPRMTASSSSEITSQVSAAPETEVSSMDDSSTVPQAVSSAPVSEPAKVVAPAASVSSQEEETSMKPNTAYYAVVDPDTGKLVWPGDKGYWTLKKQLGGDAGTIDPAHSTACQKALEEFKVKQSAASSMK